MLNVYSIACPLLFLGAVFKGNRNSIWMSREYYLKSGCYYKLELYPFDTQVMECWVLRVSTILRGFTKYAVILRVDFFDIIILGM